MHIYKVELKNMLLPTAYAYKTTKYKSDITTKQHRTNILVLYWDN